MIFQRRSLASRRLVSELLDHPNRKALDDSIEPVLALPADRLGERALPLQTGIAQSAWDGGLRTLNLGQRFENPQSGTAV